jgi:hypothetical protein
MKLAMWIVRSSQDDSVEEGAANRLVMKLAMWIVRWMIRVSRRVGDEAGHVDRAVPIG